MPICVINAKGKQKNWCQLVPCRVSQQNPAALADTVRLMNAFSYSLGAFQTDAFALVPGVSESAHELFRRNISVLYSPLGLLDVTLLFSKARHFRGVSLLLVPRMKVPDTGHKPLVPQGEAPDL